MGRWRKLGLRLFRWTLSRRDKASSNVWESNRRIDASHGEAQRSGSAGPRKRRGRGIEAASARQIPNYSRAKEKALRVSQLEAPSRSALQKENANRMLGMAWLKRRHDSKRDSDAPLRALAPEMSRFPDISSERLRVCRDRSPALGGSKVAARVCLLGRVFKRFESPKVGLSSSIAIS